MQRFPLLFAPSNAKDNQYPALKWQPHALRRLFTHYSVSDEWLHSQIDLARYIHVPVGNIPADHHAFACDVFFARQLRRQNHVLWVSPSTRPDLGGKEDDDNRLMTDSMDRDTLTINNPGVYETACVDITLVSLPVSAVVQSALVNDKEGTGGVTGNFDTTQHNLDDMMGRHLASAVTPFDESAQCMPAFRVMKSMVNVWLQQVVRHADAKADELLQHFYRWLKSPTALLFDPALLRMVRDMMKKLFLQLVGELQTLGGTPIYASFNRLLLRTEKTSARDAREYTQYILDVVRRKQLFSILHLDPTTIWEHLVWMDPANYGGVNESSVMGSMKRVPDEAGSLQSTPRRPKRVALQEDEDADDVAPSSSSRRPVPRRPARVLEDSEDDEDDDHHSRRNPPDSPAAASEGSVDHLHLHGSDVEDEDEEEGDMRARRDGPRRQNRRRRRSRPQQSESGDMPEDGYSTPTSSHRTPRSTQGPDFEILMHWNIQKYLPENMCQEQFEKAVAKWILMSYGARREARQGRGGVGQTPIKNRGLAQASSQPSQKPAQTNIRRDLTELLMRSVKGIHDVMPGDTSALEQSADFPLLAGSHLKLTNPALEFIKFVTHILLFDKKARSDSARLKRDLLRIINVREFAPETKFQDPCDTFLLHEVICTFCNV